MNPFYSTPYYYEQIRPLMNTHLDLSLGCRAKLFSIFGLKAPLQQGILVFSGCKARH